MKASAEIHLTRRTDASVRRVKAWVHRACQCTPAGVLLGEMNERRHKSALFKDGDVCNIYYKDTGRAKELAAALIFAYLQTRLLDTCPSGILAKFPSHVAALLVQNLAWTIEHAGCYVVVRRALPRQEVT